MSVITISRKYGSMGTYIGKKLAQKIGYSYVDKNVLSKIMNEYGFNNFENIYEGLSNLKVFVDEDRDSTINFLALVILAVAQHDNVVIEGRGSFGILNSFSDVINVRISAPENCRINRLMEQRNITEIEAKKIVNQNDKLRKHFVEYDFKFDYDCTRDFDFMFDTSIVPPDMCVDWIEQIYAITKDKRHDVRHSVKSIEVDSVLENCINEMLRSLKDNKDPILYQIEK